MRAPRFLVVDDLTIADVAEDEVANSVVVTVVKHSGRSHQIRFFHPDALRRAHWVHALHAWRLAGTALTYVRTPRDGTLVDAAARFQACFAG